MIKTISSSIKYKNRWMTVYEDIIERPSGAQGIYGFVDKIDFVAILAIQDGYIYLVEQYRYPIKSRSLEIPMGAWQSQPNVDPKLLALGELKEETGYQAGSIEKIGFLHVSNDSSNEGCHVFFATDLTFVGTDLDPEEEDLELIRLPLKDFEQKITEGNIRSSCTVACYGLAKLKNII